MIHIAIVEDDRTQAEFLRAMLDRFSDEEKRTFNVDIFNNGIDLLENYNGKYDIILLDIEMPFMNGLDVARKIRESDSTVILIFVTNMAQFAINGYEVNAIGYLVKPVIYFGLKMALQKAISFVSDKREVDIVINTRHGVRVVPSRDVQYVESVKHDIVYHTAYEEISRRGTLKEIESELSAMNFIRSNSCYIINLKYVRSIENGMVELHKATLPISRDRKKEITTAFMRYLGGKKNV